MRSPRPAISTCLINNAGAGAFGPLEGFSDEEVAAQIATLLLGPLRLIRLTLPGNAGATLGAGRQCLVLGRRVSAALHGAYSLSKAALSALTEGLSMELIDTGVRLIDVRPGDFATRFHESTRRIGAALAEDYAPNLEIAWNAIDRNMNRAQHPQKVADTLVRIVEGEIRRPIVTHRRCLSSAHRAAAQPARDAFLGAMGTAGLLRAQNPSLSPKPASSGRYSASFSMTAKASSAIASVARMSSGVSAAEMNQL